MKFLKKSFHSLLFLSLSFCISPNHAFALCDTGTCYVARDGSGDFNCDGTDDHVQINQALSYAASHSGTTVYFKGPATYSVSFNQMYIGSNTTITGDLTAVVKMTSQPYDLPTPSLTRAVFQANSESTHDITFYGFVIDGANRDRAIRSGNNHINLIQLIGTSNVSVHDMVLTNGLGDGLKVRHYDTGYLTKNTNVYFYNNTVNEIGHDGVWVTNGSNIFVYNNFFSCRCNSGVRIANTRDVFIYNNEITAKQGGAGIEIQKSGAPRMYNIQVYNNYIHGIRTMGIYIYGYGTYDNSAATGVHIHHNIINGNGTSNITEIGGIVIAGFDDTLIENNVLVGNHKVGISHRLAYPERGVYNFTGSGYVTTVRNNIIVDTVPGGGVSTAYGISNELSSTHSFILQNNCVYNPGQSNYNNISNHTTDINVDPLFASSTDYHLKSQAGRWDGSAWVTDTVSSPCIDTGYAPSSYANEPQNNGSRINIGRYGNTTAASLSGTSPQSQMPSAPAADSFPVSDTSSEDSSDTSTTATISYYNPTSSILNSSPFSGTNSALSAGEQTVDSLYPKLGNAPLSATDVCSQVPNSAGFIPCGRNTNDPATAWNECSDCTLCSLLLMGQLSIEFLVKVAGVAATLAIILSGFLYVLAAGRTDLISKSKSMIKYTLIGFIVVFVAWTIVDSLLMTFGYIDPIGGSWYTVC